jgi:hypothetical protein
MNWKRMIIAPFAAQVLAGCVGTEADAMDGPEVDFIEDALLESNALVPNALVPNALIPGALGPSALAARALDPGALAPDVLAGIQAQDDAGDLSRMLLRYIVGCALDTTQHFSFSWIDADQVSHDERYEGRLGLAPAWATGPLDLTGQRWISACVASRTNRYGTPVIFSVRGPHDALKHVTANEQASYPAEEGAFWGNLFAETPYLRACYHEPNVQHSRAQKRVCAAGALIDGAVEPCGIIDIVGPCSTVCDPSSPKDLFHGTCGVARDGRKKVTEVVTAYLP